MPYGLSNTFETIILLLAVFSLASLTGLISERSGTVNIAIDGYMIIGGMMWCTLMSIPGFTQAFGNSSAFVALIIAAAAGSLYSILLSVATINFLADHVVAGTALNMIAPAIAMIMVMSVTGQGFYQAADLFQSTDLGWAGSINTTAWIYLMIAFAILGFAWFLLNRTTWGLRLRSAGENPYALETAGISVNKTRWKVNFIAGFLAGMAGAMFVGTLTTFSSTVQGTGYLALAILIFGQWRMLGITIGTILFSTTLGLIQGYGFLPNQAIDPNLMYIIPFMLPLLALIFIKISGEEKITKRFVVASKKTWTKVKKHEHVIDWVGLFTLTIYGLLFWWWFYPIYQCAKWTHTDKKLMDRVMNQPSIFLSAGAPKASGQPYKKDMRT